MALESQTTHAGSAFVTLLIGMLAAAGSLWFLAHGSVMAAVGGWFIAWLVIWASVPMLGHVFHLDP